MKYFATITVCLLAGFGQLSAQSYEVGMALGLSNYAGELTSNGFRSTEYHPAMGLFARYNHSPRLAAKASITLGQVSGSDANSGKASTLSRNLEFRSRVHEVAVMGEFNITPYAIRNNQGSAIYLTAGLSGFYFNPQAPFQGRFVDLQPLGTEGQGSSLYPDRDRYSRFAMAIPFGGGVKINVTNRANIGFELVMRRTFTDYLDDVSGSYPDIQSLYAENPLAATLSYRTPEYMGEQMPNPMGNARGNSAVKDYYMFALLTFSFNLTNKQGLDFDKKYHIFKDPPPALSYIDWRDMPRA